jgi:hypothetical protein
MKSPLQQQRAFFGASQTSISIFKSLDEDSNRSGQIDLK